MSVRRLDKNGDWTFGQGRSNYIDRSNEIRQNVTTRIRSFQRDWFLDTQANIDWFNILSQKQNQQTILNEVRRVTLSTDGVREITRLEIIDLRARSVTILLEFTDIYGEKFLEQIGIADGAA